MADTGAPWNIPYAEPSDLVRDWPDLSEDVADAVAAGLTDASLIKQVASTTKTDTFVLSATTSTPFTDITGLSVTITPSTVTSKVLLIAQSNASTDAPMIFRINGGNASDYVGDASGSRLRAAIQASGFSSVSRGLSIVHLDSPATTSPVTYTLQCRSGGVTAANVHINRSESDENDANRMRTASSITAIEVAA